MSQRKIATLVFTPLFAVLLLGPMQVEAKKLNRRMVAVIKLQEDAAGNPLMDTKETAATAAGVARALRYSKQHPDYKVQDLHGVLNAGGEGDHLANRANGLQFYEAGLKDLREGNPEEAVEQMGDAAALLERSFVYLPKSKVFKTLLLHLGEAQLTANMKKSAQESFTRAVLMGAKAKWAPLEAKALKLFNKMKKSVYMRPSGQLEVITEPENVEVYLDGRFRGVSPMDVENVLEGKHIITLKKLGFKRVSRTIDVKGSEESTEVLEDLEFARRNILMKQLFAKLPTAVTLAERSADKIGGNAINLIKRMLRCEVAVVVRIKTVGDAQEVQAMVFDTVSRRLLNTHTQLISLRSNLRNRTAFRAFTKKLMSFDYAVALGGATDPGPVVLEDGGIVSKWWFWTAIGAVVVGATAGGVYAVMNQEEPPPFSKDGSGAMVLSF
jgi:hypothetical protein